MQLLNNKLSLILAPVLVLILVAWVMGDRLMADCSREEFVENFRSVANPNVSQSELYTYISENLIRRERESTRDTLVLIHGALSSNLDPFELQNVDRSVVELINEFDPGFTLLSEQGVTDEYLDRYLEFKVERALLETERDTLEQAWQNKSVRYQYLPPNCGPLRLSDVAVKALILLAAGAIILFVAHRVRAINRNLLS